MATYYVYMLRLKDERIYVGHTNNLVRRGAEHVLGKGSRTSRLFGPGQVIFVEPHPDRAAAVRRERQIRRWTRAKKESLARGNIDTLRNLSKKRRV